MYGCSLSLEGPMVAMNAATGDIEWMRDSGTSCIGDGTVYWGTGYRAFAPISSAGDPNGN